MIVEPGTGDMRGRACGECRGDAVVGKRRRRRAEVDIEVFGLRRPAGPKQAEQLERGFDAGAHRPAGPGVGNVDGVGAAERREDDGLDLAIRQAAGGMEPV